MQHYTTAPPSAAPGLDLFAAAWLERFTTHGGQIILNPDGSGMFYQITDHYAAPGYEPLPDDWTPEQKRIRDNMDCWLFRGAQRELEALLDMVPGGRAAVKAHVKAFASEIYADGKRHYR